MRQKVRLKYKQQESKECRSPAIHLISSGKDQKAENKSKRRCCYPRAQQHGIGVMLIKKRNRTEKILRLKELGGGLGRLARYAEYRQCCNQFDQRRMLRIG